MTKRKAVERRWSVNGLNIAGLSWGEPGEAPLLMLHGWLDNAASFVPLAPLLEGYHVVALDLTGHGKSDWRSADASYQIWDDLPELLGVVDQLGWDQFDLLGHSRGAIIAALLASACSERVSHLVMLDALTPQPVAESEFPAQLRRFLQQKPRLLDAENRVFAAEEEAVDIRRKSGLTDEASALLVRRGLRSCEGGFTWTTDRRLHGASAVKLTQGQNDAMVAALGMPALLLLAEGGRLALSDEFMSNLGKYSNLHIEQVEGGHHFHMDQPLAALVSRMLKFLQQEDM